MSYDQNAALTVLGNLHALGKVPRHLFVQTPDLADARCTEVGGVVRLPQKPLLNVDNLLQQLRVSTSYKDSTATHLFTRAN
jgi:hypothetical protein